MHRFSAPAAGSARRFQKLAAAIAALIGLATLLGLATGIDFLIRWFPRSTTMNPITAVLMVAGGIVILIEREDKRRLFRLVAVMMVTAGVLKLTQAALGRPLGIDQLVSRALKLHDAKLPDAIAPNTAAAFILLAGALLIGKATRPSKAIAAQAFASGAMAIAVMAMIGFILGAATINHLTFNRMAINTAVGLAALSMAILAINPEHGLMRLLLNQGPSGALARMALPICLGVPVLLGVVRLWLQHAFGFSTGDGVAIMVAGNIALTLGLLWGSLILLLRSDAELRANAAALAVSEAQYRQAGRIGKMGHWQYDASSRALYWTNEFRALLGIPADLTPTFEVMDQRIHPDDREQATQYMERALAHGEDWSWQLRLLAPDGSIQFAKSHGICRRGADGSLVSILGVLADTTELELARRGAEAATLSQAAFLANMSHEIRTPLNGVIGFITLLLDSKLNAIQRRYLALVDESARMLLKLLNDILDLSKIEAGHVDITPHPSDLRQIIRHTVRLMAPVAEQKAITVNAIVDPDFPDAVMLDGERFRQILLNVLGNSIKFTDHGTIDVHLETKSSAADGPTIRVTIADSGIGIPPDRLEAMFRPFEQADNSTSRKFGGTGLGLSISRQLASLMGGSLSLASVEGEGTTVELSLPLVPSAPVEVSGHLSPAGVFNGGDDGVAALVADAHARPGRTILVVEDLELNRVLVGAMLGRLGHRVEFANDGAIAVEQAARLATDPTAWDMILMDVQMPVMNGNDATRAIRAMGGAAATIPIIALSANAFAAEIQQSRDSGMDQHLVKPIDFTLLATTIERWADRPVSPGQNRRRA
ncbi:MAG: ATP-binding protein [Sphingomicrobium sp.]